MAVFAVIAPEADPRLEPAVRDAFPDSFYKITETQFLVTAAKLTTNQVAEKLNYTAFINFESRPENRNARRDKWFALIREEGTEWTPTLKPAGLPNELWQNFSN